MQHLFTLDYKKKHLVKDANESREMSLSFLTIEQSFYNFMVIKKTIRLNNAQLSFCLALLETRNWFALRRTTLLLFDL